MCILVLIEVAILVGSLFWGGIFTRLDQNAKDILDQKVINRKSYLQNEMLNSWSNIETLANHINATAKDLDTKGIIDFDTLDESSVNATPLILAVTDELISTMRSRRVTGAFVIFNNQDLDLGLEDKPGIYIRDLDPMTKASLENGDLLIHRAPAEVVRKLNISTDSSWRPRFEFQKRSHSYYDFFYRPFQEALYNNNDYTVADLGYWGGAFTLDGDDKEAITYTLPLINDAGNVYGVVGVDLTLNYLNKMLPSNELLEDEVGSYLLAIHNNDALSLTNVFVGGVAYRPESNITTLQKSENDYYITNSSAKLYASVQYLDMYNSNTPFSSQRWALIGLVDTKDLFAFTDKVVSLLLVAIVLTLLVGFSSSLIASYIISKPIKRLSGAVEASATGVEVTLGRTHIEEIDQLASRMEQLNQNIRNTALKFSNILQMASVKMAGFEYNEKTEELFISDNFFEILLDFETATATLSAEAFQKKFGAYKKYIISGDYNKKEYLFKIPTDQENIFINLRLVINGEVYTGVIENVTNTILEKNVIEYERDHDALTGLLNRRAFIRIMEDLFINGTEKLKIAALLMLDLDNLKYINDNYGHDSGDSYIGKAAETFRTYTPDGTIISRISGDEFFIFYYGYQSEAEIEVHIKKLKNALAKAYISLSDQKEFRVGASGGIAWYPQDSDSFERLQHYADYAMYAVKRSNKGTLTEFNLDDYLVDSSIIESKKELNTLIDEGAVQFYFQPIVDSQTGAIFAYESLMRSYMPTLKDPSIILKLAKQEGRLGEIETLTWFHSIGTYIEHIKAGNMEKNQKLFLNSISNQILSDEKIAELEGRYLDYLKNVVIEVTEGEEVDETYHLKKEECMRRWHSAMAIDDYGSGYNGDRLLLFIAPKYVKVDMEIIRGIDANPDKCKIVENIVNYAHERDMKIIAEGIETIGELKQVIRLHVDYLQGYLLAKPQSLPPKIPDDVVNLIQNLQGDAC